MSLFKRKFRLIDGTWSYTWAYDFEMQGQRYRGSFGKRTTTDAKDLYARVRSRALDGQRPAKPLHIPTVHDFLPEFLTSYAAHASPRSVDRYRVAAVWLDRAFGPYRLSDVSDQVLDRYIQYRRQAGRSPVTVNREVGCLRHLLATAILWKRLGAMPLSPRTKLRELPRQRILSDAEEPRLLEACGEPLVGMVVVALDTGFRESELVALTRPRVNRRQGLLTVLNAYAKNGETRTLEMTDRVAALIERRLRDIDLQDTTTPILGYGQASSVKRAFRRAADRAGLTGLRFHDLRRTFATRLLLAKVPLVIVQALMGHKTVGMTMRYLTLTDRDLTGVIGVLNRREVPTVSPTVTETLSRPHG